ncbi:RNA polymerase factor sigma-54 [Rhizobium leguminosarum]|uniref:RNA polymerase factor sigma-54 n=1 Tax=Rhizobium leguminosarum TaxID=384 RepID=UPI001C8FBD8C|nr:RNA polymerase factor sigma-54 [Rhizobium leguminosarum]MBY2918680.1 RNA polymerase factor sigma-54 [Rhizobium leguminosarum]MBY2973930.1 RNA polymerase factor sigma-54 [Rhizobium leguminosarum]MBY2981330.1 RNA polymerase factor sigma-54 [Rhizobium leguminosarum]MBY3009880.1 RNA polymerase factor sigma-54 [Rhizobium leguminosarum]
MKRSASLFLHQTQSFVMSPQRMQSIQLLQMNHFELSQFIAQEVEQNPLLEFQDDNEVGGECGETQDGEYAHQPEDAGGDDGYDNRDEALSTDWYDNGGSASTSRLNDELDTNYTNVFPDDAAPKRVDAPELVSQWKSMPGSGDGADYDIDDFVAGQVSLRDHLAQQIPFALPDMADRLIAQYFVDQLDERGRLQADIVEASERLGTSLAQAERVLATLQSLDPPGVFARSLAECFAIQLRQKDRYDPAMQAVVENLELLARRDFATLKRLCGVDEEDLLDMLDEIRQLNAKPGSNFEAAVSEAIIPDVVVRASSDGGWLVELNPDAMPRPLVNKSYSSLVKKNNEARAFLAGYEEKVSWLMRSLDERAKTIMKVASEIVRQQDAFLLHGVDHLRPLNQKTVAEAIEMDESTVSRVTSNKYMLTPRGFFKLKYFFTVSISAVAGGDSHSAEAVRHKIRELTLQETPEVILSDNDIVDMLKKGGVNLARRTVAKYREEMNIASSVQRRREKRALAKVAGF